MYFFTHWPDIPQFPFTTISGCTLRARFVRYILMTGVPKRLNQRDMDSSSYRLSRVPQKFSTKVVKDQQQDSYTVNYYASNPIDTRTPEDKLEEINEKLTEELGEDEMFALLIQKRALSQMIYGENSTEAIIATTELGAFYNKNGKPNSAMRNLAKVQAVAKTADISEEQALTLAVELADACLNASAKSRQDKGKQVATADSALTPHAKTETADLMVSFRRELYLARIRSYRNRWRDSLKFYIEALAQYEPAHPKDDNDKEKEKEEDIEEANLCVEAGQVAEKCEAWQKAIQLYTKAKGLYEEMEYEEDALRLANRIDYAEEMRKEQKQKEEEEQLQEDFIDDGEEDRGEPAEEPADDEGKKEESDHSDHEHHSEEHHSEEHHSEEHNSEGHHSDEHHSEEHNSDEHHSEEHNSEGHHSEEHNSDEHHSEEHHSEEHHSEEHHSEPGPNSDDPQSDEHHPEDEEGEHKSEHENSAGGEQHSEHEDDLKLHPSNIVQVMGDKILGDDENND